MLKVSDIMTTDVVTIRSSVSVAQAIALMQTQQVRSLVVEKASQCSAYGMITERDIVYQLTATGSDPTHVLVGEIMSSPCTAVKPTLSLTELAKQLLATGRQRTPVVEGDRLVGIVSVTDIIMNSNVKAIEIPKGWTDSVEVSLRRKRLGWADECQIEAESEVVYGVLEELRL